MAKMQTPIGNLKVELSNKQRQLLSRLVADGKAMAPIQAGKFGGGLWRNPTAAPPSPASGTSETRALDYQIPSKPVAKPLFGTSQLMPPGVLQNQTNIAELASILEQIIEQPNPPPYGPGDPGHLEPPTPAEIDCTTGSISFDGGVPVGGWATLRLYPDGNYQFSGHFHDSGFPSYDEQIVCIIASTIYGDAYAFTHSGNMAGTFDPGSRDDDWFVSGQNPDLNDRYGYLALGYAFFWYATVNWDPGKDFDALVQYLKDIGIVVNIVKTIV